MHGTGRCFTSLAIALGSALLLTACGGGGGGGGGNAAPTAQTGAGAQQPAPARTPTQADVNRFRAADPAKNLDSATGAARALPRFGSVTQSTNVDSNGVTTDRASAAFDGTGMTVRVTRADSSVLTIDTADAFFEDERPDTRFLIPGAQRTERSWGALNVSDRAATLSAIGVTSAGGDSDDWLALGAWLHIAGRNLLSSAPTVTSIDMGAFVDGPELRSHPTTLPVTGTARYEGYAGGFYAARYGNGFSNVASGTEAFGAFDAVATLTADFADNSISGCVGCKGDMSVSGVFTDGGTGQIRSFSDVPDDAQIRLGEAQIAQDGTFRVRDVTYFSPTAARLGIGVARQEGTWGGKFSNLSVETGEPSLAAGTFGGEVTLSDGSRSAYVGAFGAGKQ